jgi:steroid 5-alpha reductase family enzyme
MTEVFLSNAVLVAGMLTGLWAVSVVKRDASIIDPFWSLGFLLIGWNSFRFGAQHPAQLAYGAVLTLWAVRLAAHLLIRNHGLPEDPRYQAFRRRFGAHRYWWVSFFQVFVLQGVLMLVISWPVQLVMRDAGLAAFAPWHAVGLAVALAGVGIESVADWQLTAFRANPALRGQVLATGLWRYSRHPNYFGESVIWWGLWLAALPTAGGLAAVFAPVVMTVLLLRVSGVTLLEKTLKTTKPAYQAYIERTSAFVLWPLKTGARRG